MEKQKLIGYELHTLDKMFGRKLHLLFEEQNLTHMQSWIIRYLYEHQEEQVYQKDLESFFKLARSSATCILQGMEKQGYLTRCAVENDARLKQIVLTEKGTALQMAVIKQLEETEQTVRQNISDEELDVFFRVVKKMKNNLTQASGKE